MFRILFFGVNGVLLYIVELICVMDLFICRFLIFIEVFVRGHCMYLFIITVISFLYVILYFVNGAFQIGKVIFSVKILFSKDFYSNKFFLISNEYNNSFAYIFLLIFLLSRLP